MCTPDQREVGVVYSSTSQPSCELDGELVWADVYGYTGVFKGYFM